MRFSVFFFYSAEDNHLTTKSLEQNIAPENAKNREQSQPALKTSYRYGRFCRNVRDQPVYSGLHHPSGRDCRKIIGAAWKG